MTIPTFMVIGAQKSATTWLYECLREHPEVYVSDIKEIHYFCNESDCRHSKLKNGIDWYLSNFKLKEGVKHTGEFTIDYLYYDYIPERLYELNKDFKLFILLRNPIDRAYSAYWMKKRHEPDYPSFESFINVNEGYIARGFYYSQIKNYLKFFNKEQIKILYYDDIKKDPVLFLKNVFEFLEIDHSFMPATVSQKIGETKALPGKLGVLFYKNISPFIQIPVVNKFWRFLKSKYKLKNNNQDSKFSYPKMSNDTRQVLVNLYKKENEKLFEYTGREMRGWYN